MDRDSSSCKIPIFVLSFGAFVTNIVMIWLVLIRKQVEGRFRIQLINLGIIDISFVISVVLRVSIQDGDDNIYLLIFFRSLFQCCKWVRFFSLIWIVTERVLAVYKPIQYRNKYSHYSCCKIVIILWVLPLVYVVVVGIIKGKKNVNQKFCVPLYGHTLILVIVSCMNIAVPFGIAKKTRNSVAVCKSKTSRRRGMIRTKREKKSAMLTFFLVSAFIVCNIPAVVAHFLYGKGLAEIAASCNMKISSFTASALFLTVIDVTLDPILYFFANHLNSLYPKRIVMKRGVNAVCGLKGTVGDNNRLNTSQVRAITKDFSNDEILSDKARSGSFLTKEISMHAMGSQCKSKVPVIIEVEDEGRVAEDGCISECSSYANKSMDGKDLYELLDRCDSNRNESEVLKNSSIHNTTTL